MHGSEVWFDSVIMPVSAHSGKFTTRMVTYEKQRKTELTHNSMFLQNR